MQFNPFAFLTNENGLEPWYYYEGFGFLTSISLLDGSMERLGILDYVLILPALAKLLHAGVQSWFTETIVRILSIPKNILSFVGAIILLPITAVINLTLVSSEYKKELNKINELDVNSKAIGKTSLSANRTYAKLGEILTYHLGKGSKFEDRYIIEYKKSNNKVNERIKLYPGYGCHCNIFASKPHDATRDSASCNPSITIPFTKKNKAGIESILKVGAFFSEDLDKKDSLEIQNKLSTL